jgi:DNA helicase HerA-like ATPase
MIAPKKPATRRASVKRTAKPEIPPGKTAKIPRAAPPEIPAGNRQAMLDGRPDPGRIGIFGRSGSGKSWHFKDRLGEFPRIVVFDPQDEYGRRAGWTRATDIDQVKAQIIARPRDFQIGYVPTSGDEPGRLETLAALFIQLAQPYLEGKTNRFIYLAIEELNMCFTSRASLARFPSVVGLVARGRRRGVGVIGLSQRPYEVSPTFRANLSEIVMFSLPDADDAKAAAQGLAGVDWQELQGLPAAHYVRKNNATGEVMRGRNIY